MKKSSMSNVLKKYLDQLKKLPQNEFLIKVKGANEISVSNAGFVNINSIGLSFDKEIDKILVIAYLAKSRTFEFIESNFDELYDELVLYEEKGEYVFRTIGYIPEIELDAEIEIDNMKLVPVNGEYLEFILNTYDMFKSRYTMNGCHDIFKMHKNIFSGTFVICERFARNHNDLEPIREEIENILKSIIISQGTNKPFSLTPFYTFSYLYNNANIVEYNLFPNFDSQKEFWGVYKLENPAEIKDLYYKIKNVDSNFIGINRIVSAFQKGHLVDKFLDLMIALESVFSSVQTEATFRISLFTSILLDGDLNTYKSIRKLYGLRSGIAHGNSKNKIVIEDYILLDEIVRKSVMKIIDFINEKKDLNKFEEEILCKIFSKDQKTSS